MAEEVLVGAFTLGGVAVGAGLAYLADRRLWVRSQTLTARVLLVDSFAHIWGDTGWDETQIHIERLRAHLDMLDVSGERVDALLKAIRICRGEIAKQRQEENYDPDYGPGLTREHLSMYRAAVDAIVADLRK